MALGLGFIKRLGSNTQRPLSDDLVLKHTNDFELAADGPHSAAMSPATSSIFSLENASRSIDSISSVGSNMRLGRGRNNHTEPSVMFDAESFTQPAVDEHKPRMSPPSEKSPVISPENRVKIEDQHVVPTGSGMTFQKRIEALNGDVHAAVEQEVRARQIRDAEKPRRASSRDDSRHNQGNGRPMTVAQITDNFNTNGNNLDSAMLALELIDANYQHIPVSARNSPHRGAIHEAAAQMPSSVNQQTHASRAGYDNRDHGGGGIGL